MHGLALKSAGAQRTSQSRLRLASFFSKALSHNETSQSLLRNASSPDRGATGVPVLVLLDELGFSKPETEVLRCLGQRHLNNALTEGARTDAVSLDSGALFFAQDKTFFVQQGLPDLPMARPLGELARQRLRGFVPEQHSSVEHSPAAVANEGKARLFKSRKATTHRPTRPAKGSPFGRADASAPERVCSGTALFGGAQSSSRFQ